MIRDQVASSLGIELSDFDYVPFNQEGGVGQATRVFGSDLQPLLDELSEKLSA
jgi:type I restriction enzyme R subunit